MSCLDTKIFFFQFNPSHHQFPLTCTIFYLTFQVPRCTFTHPEVATVGMTLNEASQHLGASNVSAKMRRLDHVDRAVCEGAGFLLGLMGGFGGGGRFQ